MIKGLKRVPRYPGDEWIPLKEAIKRLGITYPTLYQRVRMGLLEAVNWAGVTFVKIDDKADKKSSSKSL
jgi:predicted site-specific integrase-resolvase